MEGVGWGDPNKLGEDEVCVWWGGGGGGETPDKLGEDEAVM